MKRLFEAIGEAAVLVFALVLIVPVLAGAKSASSALCFLFGGAVLVGWRLAANWGKR